MAKQSAGILLFRKKDGSFEVLLAHPGGPFWAKKDKGAWSIPKGEFDEEEPLVAAKREYKEELGIAPPGGKYIEIGTVKLKSGKVIYAWAVEGDFDESNLKSNEFELEWPPKTGKTQKYPEADRVRWFAPGAAKQKINAAQTEFIERLMNKLGVENTDPVQTKLL